MKKYILFLLLLLSIILSLKSYQYLEHINKIFKIESHQSNNFDSYVLSPENQWIVFKNFNITGNEEINRFENRENYVEEFSNNILNDEYAIEIGESNNITIQLSQISQIGLIYGRPFDLTLKNSSLITRLVRINYIDIPIFSGQELNWPNVLMFSGTIKDRLSTDFKGIYGKDFYDENWKLLYE